MISINLAHTYTFKATDQIKILPTVPMNDKVEESFIENQINQLPSVPTATPSEKATLQKTKKAVNNIYLR